MLDKNGVNIERGDFVVCKPAEHSRDHYNAALEVQRLAYYEKIGAPHLDGRGQAMPLPPPEKREPHELLGRVVGVVVRTHPELKQEVVSVLFPTAAHGAHQIERMPPAEVEILFRTDGLPVR